MSGRSTPSSLPTSFSALRTCCIEISCTRRIDANTKDSTKFENDRVSGERCAATNRAVCFPSPRAHKRSVEGERRTICAARTAVYAGSSSGNSVPAMCIGFATGEVLAHATVIASIPAADDESKGVVYQGLRQVKVPLRLPTLRQVPGEIDAEHGADADVWKLAADAEAVDGFSVDAQERGCLARGHEFPRKAL